MNGIKRIHLGPFPPLQFLPQFQPKKGSRTGIEALLTNFVALLLPRSVPIQRAAAFTNEAKHRFTGALGGTLSGETKLGIMLRPMAGASYLDVLLTHRISTSSVYSVFQATSWVVITFDFPSLKWITFRRVLFSRRWDFQKVYWCFGWYGGKMQVSRC
jgi:hypothetical protein